MPVAELENHSPLGRISSVERIGHDGSAQPVGVGL